MKCPSDPLNKILDWENVSISSVTKEKQFPFSFQCLYWTPTLHYLYILSLQLDKVFMVLAEPLA